MSQLKQLLSDGITLTPDEEQLLTYLAWLLDQVDEREKRRVLGSLTSRLSRQDLDHAGLMNELGTVITEFEPAEA